MTDTTTYTLKCVVDDDPNNSALQRLRFYVGGTLRLTSFTVDDSWPGGRVGLVRLTSPTATTLQWDNFKVGQDNGGNGSIDDGGDYVFASYDFGATHLTLNLGYDNNGNLTDDASLRYRYDGWNRLVRACYSAQDPNDPNQCFAQYSYLADGRRSENVVTLRGAEAVANDGGNQTVRFLYGSQSPDREGAGQPPWSIFETRNGSNQATWQYVWGTQYIDEIVFADKNGDPTVSNDCNPDVAATGESGETPADHRYFYHQDRNWNVVAVTDYDSDPNAAANGVIIERRATCGTSISILVSPGSYVIPETALASLVSSAGDPLGSLAIVRRQRDQYANMSPPSKSCQACLTKLLGSSNTPGYLTSLGCQNLNVNITINCCDTGGGAGNTRYFESLRLIRVCIQPSAIDGACSDNPERRERALQIIRHELSRVSDVCDALREGGNTGDPRTFEECYESTERAFRNGCNGSPLKECGDRDWPCRAACKQCVLLSDVYGFPKVPSDDMCNKGCSDINDWIKKSCK